MTGDSNRKYQMICTQLHETGPKKQWLKYGKVYFCHEMKVWRDLETLVLVRGLRNAAPDLGSFCLFFTKHSLHTSISLSTQT